ncbi:MAG: hypothetical protein VYE00_07440 [Candidatus Poribacteria bacterium]|nr:hypothetical protein [Candidatus Poribacteria bacterium]
MEKDVKERDQCVADPDTPTSRVSIASISSLVGRSRLWFSLRCQRRLHIRLTFFFMKSNGASFVLMQIADFLLGYTVPLIVFWHRRNQKS